MLPTKATSSSFAKRFAVVVAGRCLSLEKTKAIIKIVRAAWQNNFLSSEKKWLLEMVR
jgi:hypothetical protein